MQNLNFVPTGISMNKKQKPVKIILFGAYQSNKPPVYPTPDEDLFYVANWGGLWARRIKKRYPELDIEVWRPEPEFNEITTRKAYGIDCTIFPTKGMLFSEIVTIGMIRRLHKYNKQYNLVIHLNDIFDWRFNSIMPLLVPGARCIISHHGGVFPDNGSIKKIIKKRVLRFSYRKIDTVTYLRDVVRQEIKNANDHINAVFLPVGANFEHFRPLDKIDCRRKLNLPLDKIIAVYVGGFFKLKGVDHILNIYHTFKDKNLEIMLVGGSKKCELYNEVVKSGCRYWYHVNHDLLRIILSAADFYIHPAFSKNFGGMDVTWMEALACNKPVLTPQFKELDFDYSELGILLDDEGTILQKSEEMMQTYHRFTKCREAAMVHLDGNTAIIDKLYEIYMK